jgi:hypothetical protein
MIAKHHLLSQLRSGNEDALFGIMVTYYNELFRFVNQHLDAGIFFQEILS